MATILSIDTASNTSGLALLRGNEIDAAYCEDGRKAAQVLLPMVQEMLQSHGVTLAQLDAIAVLAGPGSFTGIRIGLSVAQGLAFPQNIPMLGVSSMAVQAYAALTGTSHQIALVTSAARQQEIYFAAYRLDEELGVTPIGIEQVAEPQLLDIPTLPDTLASQVALVSDSDSTSAILSAVLPVSDLQVLPFIGCPVEQLARIAELRLAAGLALPPEQVLPNYVKDNMQYDSP